MHISLVTIRQDFFSGFIKNTSGSLFLGMSVLPNSSEMMLKRNPDKVFVSWDFVG